MSAEQNKALAIRFVEEVWGQANLDVVDEILAPDFEMRSATYGVKDLAAFRQFVKVLHTSYPDTHFSMEEVLAAEGDTVVSRWTFHGTDTGGSVALGTPPTNKHVTMAGISVYHLKDGKIADQLSTEDALGLVRQLQG